MEIIKEQLIYFWYYFDIQIRQIFIYWILGILSPLCMYGTILIRLNVSILGGFLAGLLIKIFFKDKKFFNFSGFDEKKSKDTDPNMFKRLLKNIWRNIKATGLYFLFGIVTYCTISNVCTSRSICKFI